MVKLCKVRKGKITPTQPPPFPPCPKKEQTNKQKERKHLGKNNQNESKGPETRNKKRRDLPILASLLYLTHKKRFLSLSRCLTHARTHAQRPGQKRKDSVHPSIHSSLTTSHRKVYLPATKGNFGHGIRGRPISQRERDIHLVSAISPSTTSSHLSTPHISTPLSTPTPPTRTTTTTTTAIQPSNDYIAPHPTRSSFFIHPFN